MWDLIVLIPDLIIAILFTLPISGKKVKKSLFFVGRM